MIVLMLAPAAYFMDDTIGLGDYLILIGMAFILDELADISEAIKSRAGQKNNSLAQRNIK